MTIAVDLGRKATKQTNKQISTLIAGSCFTGGILGKQVLSNQYHTDYLFSNIGHLYTGNQHQT